MKITDRQVADFQTTGYLMLDGLFDAGELAVLKRAAGEVFAMDRKEVVREKDGATARTAFAAHTYHEAFRRLGRHPRLVQPVERLLDGPVYMHQYKVNAKAAFDGDIWQWHQDYGTWARDDEMPEPRAMNIAVFVDEVTEFNGPLWLIPRSHSDGVFDAGHDVQTTSYPLWTLDRDTVARLVDEAGIYPAKGAAGSVLMFHGNLVHGSPPNMSPYPRTIVYLSLCHVDNHIRRFKRPEWIAHRDFAPIESLGDDCLRELAVSAAE